MSLYTDSKELKEHMNSLNLSSKKSKSKNNGMEIEEGEESSNLEFLPKDEFAAYISYARTINPKLSEEASNEL